MLSEMGVRSMIGSGGGDGFAGEDFEKELASLLREQRRQEASDRERELNIFRSGSAPPTVEGALNAIGGLFGRDVAHGVPDFSEAKNGNGFLSEEELRSNPAYLSYYYSHANLNPRLPPPLLSKEDWRSTQKLQAGVSAWGGIGDRRKMSHEEEGVTRSLFSQQQGFDPQDEHLLDPRKAPGSGEWVDKGDRLIGLALGRQKSFADVLQDDLGRRTPNSGHSSRPSSRNAFVNDIDALKYTDSQLSLDNDMSFLDGRRHGEYIHSANGSQNIVASSACVVGSSLRRSHTPDPQLIARAPSPSLPPVGTRINSNDKKVTNSLSSFNGASCTVEPDDIITAMSNISLATGNAKADENISQSKLQKGIDEHQNYLFISQSGKTNDKSHNVLKDSDSQYLQFSSFPQPLKPSYSGSSKSSVSQLELQNSGSKLGGIVESQRSTALSSKSYLKSSLPSSTSPGGPSACYQNPDNLDMAFTDYGLNAYSFNPTLTSAYGINAGSSVLGNHVGSGSSPLFEGTAATSSMGSIFAPPNLAGTKDLHTRSRINNVSVGSALQTPLNDPLYAQYLKAAEYTTQLASTFGDPSLERGYVGNTYSDLVGLQKAYIETLLQSQKQYGVPLLDKTGSLTQGYYGNPALGLGMTYPGSPLASPIASSFDPGSPLRLSDRNIRFPSNVRNFNGGALSSWRSDLIGTKDEHFPSTLLEEFKGNKARSFELAEICGHVVEFSADQYGSRFIQQKLETATTEEKTMVFKEIMPHAHSLMTDVFGNYVVQKFFEHGSEAQRRELADQLNGHVLTLSLQMYGCRVIQKAIEVVDLDQKTKMVLELDGHIMRCVRDQNGNHVIQKCIECVPPEAIQFIITTFYDQVVTLSTHPYGCRVIQRVLEHCDDPKTQKIVMDEILQSVCMLAQDQYGNYVVQHVLEHGKPHERSAIIEKLAGQIVQMSQQKFASNVVEKCLTFGGLEERQLLVTEMLGSTDENEPLQAMMKDQFANYVVQKVLETCDDQQRELILSRIKVHLNALKKYTYGKHIVARVEKLVAAGEKRIRLQSS